MPAIDVDRVRAHARRFADGFTPGQKSITILGVVAVVLAAYYFNSWAGTTEYAPLYTDLAADDASAVTQELDARGVSYKLEDGGRTVTVPRNDVYQTRVDLSAQGLPSGSSEGFPLLDKGGITKSEFSQRIDYQRALQGELARTIEAIDGVSAARVMLTIPREDVFVGTEEDKATASVLVEPTGSQQLDNETVQAIVQVVSSSVAGMAPADVTVADSLGNVLAAPGRTGSSGESLEQKSAFEDSIAAAIKSQIAASLGPGHAAVTVQADLDFSKSTSTSTEYIPPADGSEPPALTERTTSESFTGTSDGSAGLLGPDGTPSGTGAAPTEYLNEETQRENGVNGGESITEQAPGQLRRLSVSVLLDSEVVDAADADTWQSSIAAAAGIDAARNDLLDVQLVAFDTEAADQAQAQLDGAAAEQSKSQLLDMIRYVVTLLIVGLVLFLAWRAIKRSEANRMPLRVPLDLRELEAGDLMPNIAEAARLPDPTRVAIDPGPPGVELEVTQLIERQPDEVAQTLRSWLADRRG